MEKDRERSKESVVFRGVWVNGADSDWYTSPHGGTWNREEHLVWNRVQLFATANGSIDLPVSE